MQWHVKEGEAREYVYFTVPSSTEPQSPDHEGVSRRYCSIYGVLIHQVQWGGCELLLLFAHRTHWSQRCILQYSHLYALVPPRTQRSRGDVERISVHAICVCMKIIHANMNHIDLNILILSNMTDTGRAHPPTRSPPLPSVVYECHDLD
jgi:hypothetical protein